MAKEGTLESYIWYPGDWQSDPDVVRLSMGARGLYRELLDICWTSSAFPRDVVVASLLCRCAAREWRTYWPQVRHLFELKEDGWHNPRVDRDRPQAIEKKRMRSTAGSTGGQASVQAKRQRSLNDFSTDAQRLLNDCSSSRARSQTQTQAQENIEAFYVVDEDFVERLRREYPDEPVDDDIRTIMSALKNQQDADQFWKSLTAHKKLRKWRDGFHKTIKNFILEGHWKVIPKPDRSAELDEHEAAAERRAEKNRLAAEMRKRLTNLEIAELERTKGPGHEIASWIIGGWN